MDLQHLQLDVPQPQYTLFHQQDGEDYEVYSPPLMGSVSIAVPATESPSPYPSVEISLVRVVTVDPQVQPSLPSHNQGHLFQRIRGGKAKAVSKSTKSHSTDRYEATLARYSLWSVPDQVQPGSNPDTLRLTYHFSIPSSIGIPGTLSTALGDVSYVVKATATSLSGATLHGTEPIEIRCHQLSPNRETTSHVLHCPDARMALKLSLARTLEPRDQDQWVSYSAGLVPRYPVASGPRPTEETCTFISELRWCVEETVRVMMISDTDEAQTQTQRPTMTCRERRVREIASGKLKDHCNTATGARTKGSPSHQREIKFDISIPRSAGATDSRDLSSYTLNPGTGAEMAAITVEHQVRLEVVMGQDTIDMRTGDLVERKVRCTSFNTCFPLDIRDFSGAELQEGPAQMAEVLPRYDEAYLPAPKYEQVC